jgi:hypothetical protein
MTDQMILALSFLLCTILVPPNHSQKHRITSSGQALNEPCSVAEIAIVSVAYATLNTVNFGEIVLLPSGH